VSARFVSAKVLGSLATLAFVVAFGRDGKQIGSSPGR
jgi:hypothetical protein